jgi:hypothetical protein
MKTVKSRSKSKSRSTSGKFFGEGLLKKASAKGKTMKDNYDTYSEKKRVSDIGKRHKKAETYASKSELAEQQARLSRAKARKRISDSRGRGTVGSMLRRGF